MPPKAAKRKMSVIQAPLPDEDALFIEKNEPAVPLDPEAVIRDGILPLFLTTATLKLFDIQIGENGVSKTNPMKYVPKEDLVKDIQARLSISDFMPAKQQIFVCASQLMSGGKANDYERIILKRRCCCIMIPTSNTVRTSSSSSRPRPGSF